MRKILDYKKLKNALKVLPKRIFAAVLCVAMILSALPMTSLSVVAFADTTDSLDAQWASVNNSGKEALWFYWLSADQIRSLSDITKQSILQNTLIAEKKDDTHYSFAGWIEKSPGLSDYFAEEIFAEALVSESSNPFTKFNDDVCQGDYTTVKFGASYTNVYYHYTYKSESGEIVEQNKNFLTKVAKLASEFVVDTTVGYSWFIDYYSKGNENEAWNIIMQQVFEKYTGKELYELYDARTEGSKGGYRVATSDESLVRYGNSYNISLTLSLDEGPIELFFIFGRYNKYLYNTDTNYPDNNTYNNEVGIIGNLINMISPIPEAYQYIMTLLANTRVLPTIGDGYDDYCFIYRLGANSFWQHFDELVQQNPKFIAYKKWMDAGEDGRNGKLNDAALLYVIEHTKAQNEAYLSELNSLIYDAHVKSAVIDIFGEEIEVTSQESATYIAAIDRFIGLGYSKAEDSGEQQSEYAVVNTYLLRLDTGLNSGENVQYFEIRYKDNKGEERSEIILPHDGALERGYAIAGKYGETSDKLSMFTAVTNYVVDSSTQNSDGLLEGSHDAYLFQPGYKISEFIGMRAFISYPNRSDISSGASMQGWDCRGIKLYSIDELYGYSMTGYCSDEYSISFSGTQIAEMINKSGGQTYAQLDTAVAADELIFFEIDGTAGLSELPDNKTPRLKLMAEHYDSSSSEYLFKLDLADKYGAGIEAMATEVADLMHIENPIEALCLTVAYTDTYNNQRVVNMPMITSMLAWAVTDLDVSLSLPYHGVAQQGESIIFPASLPDCKTIDSVSISFGRGAAAKAGIKLLETTSSNTIYQRRYNKLAGEEIEITSFQIYQYPYTVITQDSGAILDIQVSDTSAPIQYYTAQDINHCIVCSANDGVTNIPITEYRNATDSPLSIAETGDCYIVEIETDDLLEDERDDEDLASTKDQVFIQIKYLTTAGNEVETDVLSLKTLANEFFGYWPGVTGNDVSYENGMNCGGKLYFKLDIPDVSSFVSVEFSMSSSATDDWQMKSMKIYQSSYLDKRTVVWESNALSDRTIARLFNSNNVISSYPNASDILAGYSSVYLSGKNNSYKINLSEVSQSEVEKKKEIDWASIMYSMTFKESKQDLGFVDASHNYRIDVTVADNIGATYETGDSGSTNLFYFKLVFENGNSAYVLANQQLTSDGFRTGRVESFYISTNKDYGSLTAISIIPEDNSDNDNQDPFDKLNISSISVTEERNEGLSKTWIIDNVGWIDIDYIERGAESSSSGRTGRSEAEIARSFPVTTEAYSVDFLFALTTSSYERSAKDIAASEDKSQYYPSYSGSLTATIEYYDRSGILRTQSVDIIRAMYDYAGKNPVYYNTGFVASDGSVETRAKSDSSFMLRGNHTDRFVVSLLDVSQIKRVVLGASSEVATTWNIDKLEIYRVVSDGFLQLNANNEYQRSNNVEYVCESNNVLGYETMLIASSDPTIPVGSEQGIPMNFTSHEIKISEDTTGTKAVVTSEPNNKNDSLNVYVYMVKDSGNPSYQVTPVTDYSLKADLSWQANERSVSYQVTDFSINAEENMFYALGIKASGLTTLGDIYLKASSPVLTNSKVDHIVVEHIRSGVVIRTYEIMPDVGDNAEFGVTCKPLEPFISSVTDKQVVKLYVSADSEAFTLVKNSQDLVVSLKYTTKDNAASGNEYEYSSRNVFLSDVLNADGSMKYKRVESGSLYELEFNLPNVSEITGLTVSTTDGSKISVDSACVYCYSSNKLVEYLSFTDGKAVSSTPYTMRPSNASVMPVTITIGIGNYDARVYSTGVDNGNAAPVRMKIRYASNSSAAIKELVINDIRPYISQGGLIKEYEGTRLVSDSASFSLMLEDASEIKSISLEPYTVSEESSAVMSIKSLSCASSYVYTKLDDITKLESLDIKNKIFEATISAESEVIAQEDSPALFNLADIFVKLDVEYETEAGTVKGNTALNGTIQKNALEQELIVLDADTELSINPTIIGAIKDQGCTVKLYKDNAEIGGSEFAQIIDASSAPIKFKTSKAGTYKITVSSKEDATKFAWITVEVKAQAASD